MAGIYLHIPFCKQACHYCNFHFSTSLKFKQTLLQAMHRELELQSQYLGGKMIESIYFGGGTPSLLSPAEINSFLKKIESLHSVSENPEITLEANPDDLNLEKLRGYQDTRVNRLSIGIQSFSKEDLEFMNRAHSVEEAINSIEFALKLGFTNLTIDLIYGSNTLSDKQWKSNLSLVNQFEIAHISCYGLTVEPNTALSHFVKSGKIQVPKEEHASRQFEILMNWAQKNDYEHYEISNFARAGHRAVHNSNYWKNQPYLGIGPSAHSYNGRQRRWNIANNKKYIDLIENNTNWFSEEYLQPKDLYNEYVLVSLRTVWGCNTDHIDRFYHSHFLKNIQPFLDSDHVEKSGSIYRLTNSGKLLADHIISNLFWTEY